MTGSTAGQWLGEPFVMGTPAEFAAVRVFLARIGYTEPELCIGAQVASLSEMQVGSKRRVGFLVPDSPQALAVRLFLDGVPIPWELVRRFFSAADIAAAEALGLLVDSPLDPSACIATVSLYPIEGLYIASDRNIHIEQVAAGGAPADIVYSAFTPETRGFLRYMPRAPCVDYLELCSGSGVAALVSARDFAEHACAVDITQRSTRFARFNAALNDATNVEALAGDLYAPVHGRQFDVITGHPPYVPALETNLVYRDGGEDGEQITRRMIEGLPDYLRPGGVFFCTCFMTDRKDAPVEARIRAMLGAKEHEFHILVGQARVIPVARIVGNNVAGGRLSPAQADVQMRRLLALGVTQFVDAAFLIQRRVGSSATVTRRRILSEHTNVGHMQAYIEVAAALEAPGGDPTSLLSRYPRCSPHTEIVTRSTLRDGSWVISACSVATAVPFTVEAEVPAWFGSLLSWCDGKATAMELLHRLQDATILPNEFPPANFAGLMHHLADGSFVELLDAPVSTTGEG